VSGDFAQAVPVPPDTGAGLVPAPRRPAARCLRSFTVLASSLLAYALLNPRNKQRHRQQLAVPKARTLGVRAPQPLLGAWHPARRPSPSRAKARLRWLLAMQATQSTPLSGWSYSVSGMTMALRRTRPPRVFCRSISFCRREGARGEGGWDGGWEVAGWRAAEAEPVRQQPAPPQVKRSMGSRHG
jgi:hypothetical protein